MMKFWKKTAILLLLTIMVCCCVTTAMARESLSVFSYMKTYTEGEDLQILWYTVSGADHYECTIKCGSTYLRNRSRTEDYYACYLDGSRVKAGSYKVWVGAIDANGNTIADGIIYFTVNEKDDCNHRWDEDTGACTRCDAECPHNTGYYEVEDKSTGKSISSTKHEITDTYHQECKTCRYVIKSGLKKTYTEKHSFDSNGDCKLCNYRAACTHSKKELVPHDPTYTQYDATYHKKKVVSDLVCASANCGKVIAYSDDVSVVKEKHTMSGDKCRYCGYTVEYEDVTVSVARDSSTGYVGQSIGATCTPKGGTGSYAYAWYVYCNGTEVYSTTSWDKRGTYSPTQEGTYTFKVYVTDRKNGDSANATSGTIKVTKPACTHANTSEVRKTGADTYSKLSDSKHTVYISYDVVCDACGKVVNTIKRSSTEDHTYSGSNCSRCGAAKPAQACTHEKKTSTETSRSARKTESDTYHYVDITWKDVCASCKTTLNTTRKTTEREEHAYSGNTCTKCGYIRVVKCDHANKIRQSQGSVTVKADDKRHVVTTTYRVTCADCGELLNAGLKEDAYFAHTMENGKCLYCTHTAPVAPPAACTHEKTTSASQGSVTRQYDAQRHVVTTTYTLTCAACGKVVDSAHKEDAWFDHTMENGACKYCGYASATECDHALTRRINETTTIERNYADDDRTHYQVTSWTMSCECGAVTEAQSARTAVAHKYSYRGHEEDHSHKLFDRCACGVVSYPGGYQTVDGVVYSEAEVPDDTRCCLCLGHDWAEDEPFQLEGKWQIICRVCGKLREVSEPVGANCSHEIDKNTMTEVVDLYEVNNINDAEGHNVVRKWHSEGNCIHCGRFFDFGYGYVGEMKPHKFDDQGMCEECGYVAMSEDFGVENRYEMYIESDYNLADMSYTLIGVNEYKTVRVYDKHEDEYVSASYAGLELRLLDDGGIATLKGDAVIASNSGTFRLGLYDMGTQLDELEVGVTMLSVKDSFFEYSWVSSGVVRMEDMSNIDWKKCDVLITGDVSIGEYTETSLSDGSKRVTFNAYNHSAVVIGVGAYDANGKQVSLQLIKSYWGTGSFVEEGYRTLSATGRVWDNKALNGADTTVTPVTLTVPAGGYIRVLEMYEDEAVFAANLAEGLLGTVKYYNDAESMVNAANLNEMEEILESLGKDEYYLATYNYLVRHYGHDFIDALIGTAELTEEAMDMSVMLKVVLNGEGDFVTGLISSIPGAVLSTAVDKTEDALLTFLPGMYHVKHGFQLAHDTVGMYQLFEAYERCMVGESSGKVVSYIVAPMESNATPDRVDNSGLANKRYTITSKPTVLREVPSMNYSYYLDIPVGTELEIIGSKTDAQGNLFYEVRYGYDRGYILAAHSTVQAFGYQPTQEKPVVKEEDVVRRTVRVTHPANLRMGPNGQSDFVQRVGVGTVMDFYGEKNGWYNVMGPGGEMCYVFAEYAELN